MNFPHLTLLLSFLFTTDCYGATNGGNDYRSIHNIMRSEPLAKIIRRNGFILNSLRGGDGFDNTNNFLNQQNSYSATALSKANVGQFFYEQQQQQQHQQQNEALSNQQYYDNEYQQQGQSMYQQKSPNQYYNENPDGGFDYSIDILQPQETEQDRITNWKKEQIEKFSKQKNPFELHDERGRLNLFAGIGKGSRAIMFFLLMLRNLHFIDTAESSFKNWNPLFVKFYVTIPLCGLFVFNLVGLVVALSPPSSGEQHYSKSKNRLKAILNVDKVVEIILMMYNFSKLTIFPPKYIGKEIYVSSLIHSTFFLLQTHFITKLAWYDSPTPFGNAKELQK